MDYCLILPLAGCVVGGMLKDLTAKFERAMMKLIKATDWIDEIKALLIPRCSMSPRIYGLPKIHKTGCPL